jgi:hypothetical protein
VLTSLLNLLNWNGLGTVLLVVFVAAFVAIVIHTIRRPRHEVERTARLPLADDRERS